MGYVLPIQNFQYNDYHRRTVEEKSNHFFINEPYKLILEAQYQNIKHPPTSEHIMLNKEHSKILSQSPRTIRAYEEITGKGQRFSVSI